MRSSNYLAATIARHRGIALLCALGIAVGACSEKPAPELKLELARDRARLKAELRACRDDPARAGHEHCRMVSEAWRQRFLGNMPDARNKLDATDAGQSALPPSDDRQAAPR